MNAKELAERVLVSPGAAMALASGASIYAAALVASSEFASEHMKWVFLLSSFIFIIATLAIENFHKRNRWPWLCRKQ